MVRPLDTLEIPVKETFVVPLMRWSKHAKLPTKLRRNDVNYELLSHSLAYGTELSFRRRNKETWNSQKVKPNN